MASVTGRDRLIRQLLALPLEQIKAAREALGAGAAEIAEAVARAAPRDEGDLAESVDWYFIGKRNGKRPSGVLGATSDPNDVVQQAGLAVTVEAGNERVFWARWVEFGTAASPAKPAKPHGGFWRARARKALKAHAATQPQPFFYPTVRALRRRAKSRVVRSASRAAKAAAAVQ